MPAPITDRRWLARAIIGAFIVAGAVAGIVIQRAVGCPTGGCPITSSPLFSTIYGAVIGLVVGIGFAPAR